MKRSVTRRAVLLRALRAAPLLALAPLFGACERAGSMEEARPAAPTPLIAPTAAVAAPVTGTAPEPTPTDTPSPLAAPTARAGPLKLVYGMDGYSALNLVPIVAAEKPELMLQQRLALEVVVTGSSTAAVQALLGGSVSLAGAATEAAWPAQTKSPDLKQIAAVANGTPYSLVVGRDVKQVSDLKGKPIGVTAASGGIDTTAARLILSENGLRSGEFLLISLGPQLDRAAVLRAGTVAAVVTLEPQVSQLADAGFATLDVGDDHPRLRDLQPAVVLARKSWYDTNMDAALAYLRGSVAVTKWLYDPGNRDELLTIIARTLKVELPQAVAVYDRHLVKSKTPPLDPRVDIAREGQLATAIKMLGSGIPPGDLPELIDNRIAEQALGAQS